MLHRKRASILVPAVKFTGENEQELQEFTNGGFRTIPEFARTHTDPKVTAEVWDKLHVAWIGVVPGQFILRGTNGEFYPHDEELFEKNYYQVDGPELFVLVYVNADDNERAEGPLTEKDAFARREELFDEFGARSVALVKFEVGEV